MPGPKISIILPIYNQADHISRIIDSHVHALANLSESCEILLIVNGTQRDNTLVLCQSLEEMFPSVRTIRCEIGGWGRAVLVGIAEARGSLICFTNASRTTTEDLVALIDVALHHPGTVVKARRLTRERLHRRLGSHLYNLECRCLFGLSLHDINATPKIFPAAYQPLRSLQQDNDLLDLEFAITCRTHTYPVIEMPIYNSRRHGGKSTTRLKSAIAMYTGAFRLFWSRLHRGVTDNV